MTVRISTTGTWIGSNSKKLPAMKLFSVAFCSSYYSLLCQSKKTVKLPIWAHCCGVNGIVIIYNVESPESFDHINDWLK